MSNTAKAWAILLGIIVGVSALSTATSDAPWWVIPATLAGILGALIVLFAAVWAVNQILLGDGWEDL